MQNHEFQPKLLYENRYSLGRLIAEMPTLLCNKFSGCSLIDAETKVGPVHGPWVLRQIEKGRYNTKYLILPSIPTSIFRVFTVMLSA